MSIFTSRTPNIIVHQKEQELNNKIEQFQKESVNDLLASSFPAWDLNPPAILVRRKGRKF